MDSRARRRGRGAWRVLHRRRASGVDGVLPGDGVRSRARAGGVCGAGRDGVGADHDHRLWPGRRAGRALDVDCSSRERRRGLSCRTTWPVLSRARSTCTVIHGVRCRRRRTWPPWRRTRGSTSAASQRAIEWTATVRGVASARSRTSTVGPERVHLPGHAPHLRGHPDAPGAHAAHVAHRGGVRRSDARIHAAILAAGAGRRVRGRTGEWPHETQ